MKSKQVGNKIKPFQSNHQYAILKEVHKIFHNMSNQKYVIYQINNIAHLKVKK